MGQVIDASVISEIDRLVRERYPGHYTSFSFKPIEYEKYDAKDRGGRDVIVWHFLKILLASYLDHGVIGPGGEVLELPVAEQIRSKYSSELVEPLAGRSPCCGTMASRANGE